MQREFRERLILETSEELLFLAKELALAMLDEDRLAPADIKLDRTDRIMKMVDDAKMGVLDELALVSPPETDRRMTQLRADLKAEGVDADSARPQQTFLPSIGAPA